ncbi:MAG: pyridoxamine 5'-phosphate oxidase family protein, partial [Actinomycetota bacterium]
LKMHGFVGRLAFVTNGRPMILPVNYIFDQDSIVFRTAPDSTLGDLGEGTPVAFEVDSSRPREGWSVLVQGTATEVRDAEEIERLRRGPLESWAEPVSDEWIRISIEEISGRRILED